MLQQPVLHFEHPLNERMRTFLRTEYLFNLAKFRYNNLSTEWDSRDCVTTIIELFNFIERTEFRGELLKEAERNLGNLQRLSTTPAVDQRTLDKVTKELEACLKNIRNQTTRQGLFPKGSELLNAIRQRLSISGGTCGFDIPAFHYWLNLPVRTRQSYLNQWIETLEPLEKTLTLILTLIRQSGVTTREVAVNGLFQKSLQRELSQLIRIAIRTEYTVYPEISANKHRVNIRMFHAAFENEKNSITTQEIPFELTCCVI